MTRREALEAIYIQLTGKRPVLLSSEIAAGCGKPHASPNMATCVDGMFYAYPHETTQAPERKAILDLDGDVTGYRYVPGKVKSVFWSSDPQRLIAQLKAAGYPRPAHGFKHEHAP